MAALGAVAIKTAVDFEKSMRNVNSIAQLPEKQFHKLERSVLGMAGEVAQAPHTLSEGLYDLVSSGFKANESIGILRASAKAATAGLTTTEVSVKGVAAALNAYHRPAKDASQISDDLFETVNRGVVTFEELASSIGFVLPAASTMGINLKEVGAAISTLTKEGQSGETAITNINQAVTAFIKPSKLMGSTLKELGYETAKQLIHQKGFQGAIEAVTDAVGGGEKAIGELFGNVRAMRAVFGLTGKSASSAREDVAAFNEDAGRTNQVLKEQKKSTAYQWKQLRAEAEVLAVTMGKDLIPVVRTVGGDLKDVVEGFMGLPKGTQKAIVEFGLVTVAAGPVVRLLGGVTSGIGSIISVAGKLKDAEIGSSIASAISGNLNYGKGTYDLARSFGRGKLASAAAGFFSTSFAKYLGVGLAAVGIGNIAISATQGDWKEAGFKAGGALVGGIAGAFLGPEGAMIGAGAGSILGGLVSDLFKSEKKLTPLQERLRAQADHAAEAFRRQRDAAKGLANEEDNLRSSNQRHKHSTEAVTQAHRELNLAVKRFGPNSQKAHEAEIKLSQAQHRDARTAEEAKEAHKLAGNQLRLYRHSTVEAVASEKQRLPNLEAVVDKLQKRSSREKSNIPLLERTVEKEEQLAKVNHRVNALITEAAQTAGPKFARMLRNMSTEQAEFGTHYRGLLKMLPELGKKTESAAQKAEHSFGHFTDVFSRQAGHGKTTVKSFDKATVSSLGDVVSHLNSTMTALTGKPVLEFGTKKQRGGTINEGAPSGDTVPALLERGEYVLNRNAVKAIGTSALDAINFAAAPRFQQGGPLGREPRLTGPEPLRGGGQHAIHQVYTAAMKYYERHNGLGRIIANGNRMDALHQPYLWGGGHGSTASRNGPWDCSGGISELFDGSGLPGPNFNFAPMVSGGFESWGLPGKGDVSVLANAEHVYAVVKGKGAIGTSDSNPGGGFGWISDYTFRPGFVIRHADFGTTSGGFRGSGKHGRGQNQKKGFQRGGGIGWIHEAAKPWFKGVQENTSEPIGVQNTRQAVRRLAAKLWPIARGFFPGAKGLPSMTQPSHGAFSSFVDVTDWGKAGRLVSIPTWVGQGLLGHREKGANREFVNLARQTLIHEWAHSQQKGSSPRWKVEGGAQAFARYAAPHIYAAAGIPYRNPREGGSMYTPLARRVESKLGMNWVKNGQFIGGVGKFQKGGQVGAAETEAAARKYHVPLWIEWGIAGAESTWGKGGSNLFGLLAAAEGVDVSSWGPAAMQSAKTMAGLYKERGGWGNAMAAYSGGEYGLAHVKQLFNENPISWSGAGSGGSKTKKHPKPIAKGVTVHGGTSAGGVATPGEIKAANRLGAKHAKNPKVTWNVPTSPLPSWAVELPLFQREELEGRGTTFPEREAILANAEANATFATGQTAKTLENARQAYERNPTDANWEQVERAALGVRIDRGGQAKVTSARKLFEKGIVKSTTKKIKQINWQLAHAAGRLSAKEIKQLKEKRAGLVEQRSSARGEAQGATEALRGYDEENAQEAAELEEQHEAQRREARREGGELRLLQAEGTKGTKTDDLEALEGLKKIAEEELKEAQESGNLGEIVTATQNLTQATENLKAAAIAAFEEETEGQLALAELTEGLSDDLEVLHRKLTFAEEELQKSKEEGNWAEIARWAHEVKGLTEAIKSDEGAEATAQLAEEMKGLREAIEAQNHFAESVSATSAAVATRLLADMLSGHVGTKGQLMAQTAGNGSVGTF